MSRDGARREPLSVRQWDVHDFSFKSNKKHDNEFLVNFKAIVKNPNGALFEIPGFYDGNATWKIRISPTIEGVWSIETVCPDDAGLDGHEIEFLCVKNGNSNIHGRLRIDKKYPRHFVFEDGTRYFLMGYECDWLFAIDMDKKHKEDLEKFVKKIKRFGFNHVLMNVYAYDTPWCSGKTSEYDYGPPLLHPWIGGNDNPDFTRFDLRFWKHFDKVMQILHENGVTAHLMIKVYNKMVNWPAKFSDEEYLFFKWLVARYSAYPNLVWDLTKEGWRDPDIKYKVHWLIFLKENDPYKHLVTIHDDDEGYYSGAYDGIVDFHTDQHHEDFHRVALEQRIRKEWPIVNAEFGYERGVKGLGDYTDPASLPPEEVASRALEILMAGCYCVYYYNPTAWDVIRFEDTPTGYYYFKNIKQIFEKIQYWKMEPRDDLIDQGYCLANDCEEYLFMIPNSSWDSLYTIRVNGKEDDVFRMMWLHPLAGEEFQGGFIKAGLHRIKPPLRWMRYFRAYRQWEGLPVLLHVKRRKIVN